MMENMDPEVLKESREMQARLMGGANGGASGGAAGAGSRNK